MQNAVHEHNVLCLIDLVKNGVLKFPQQGRPYSSKTFRKTVRMPSNLFKSRIDFLQKTTV